MYFYFPDSWLFLLFLPALVEEIIFSRMAEPQFVRRYACTVEYSFVESRGQHFTFHPICPFRISVLGRNTERCAPSFHVHQSEFCLGVAYVGDGSVLRQP